MSTRTTARCPEERRRARRRDCAAPASIILRGSCAEPTRSTALAHAYSFTSGGGAEVFGRTETPLLTRRFSTIVSWPNPSPWPRTSFGTIARGTRSSESNAARIANVPHDENPSSVRGGQHRKSGDVGNEHRVLDPHADEERHVQRDRPQPEWHLGRSLYRAEEYAASSPAKLTHRNGTPCTWGKRVRMSVSDLEFACATSTRLASHCASCR